jgi:hypothetical protein
VLKRDREFLEESADAILVMVSAGGGMMATE